VKPVKRATRKAVKKEKSAAVMEQTGSPNQQVTGKRTNLRKKRVVEAQEKGE
jgi:hypothetical protein